MCGRYYVDDITLEEIEKVVREVDQKIRQEHFNADIHPTDLAPVIINGKSGMKLNGQYWGYPGIQNKGTIFNARAESVLEKRMFHNGIYKSRAIIPAKHFYEWNSHKEKNTFSRPDNKVLYLAGFYDKFNGTDRFVILTTSANESMIQTHDRMPLVLEDYQLEDWIYNDKKTRELLHQVPTLLDRITEYEQQTLF